MEEQEAQGSRLVGFNELHGVAGVAGAPAGVAGVAGVAGAPAGVPDGLFPKFNGAVTMRRG